MQIFLHFPNERNFNRRKKIQKSYKKHKEKKPPEKRTNAFGRYCEPIKNHNTWSRKRFYPNLQSLYLIPLPDGY